MSCARLAVILAVPAVAFSTTLSFQNHSQSNDPNHGGGAPLLQHADLNADGREDLVFAYHPEMGGQNTFAVQLSTGDGTYGPATSYATPSSGIDQLLLGDFNNDGFMDVPVFGYDGYLYLYQNDGKGNFALVNTSPYVSDPTPGGSYSAQAVVGDFNHDSLSDLAFVTAGRLYVWFGNGKGGFTPGPSMGVNGSSPTLGDFDGDGKADLLLVDTVNYARAYVLYGDGAGNFPQTTEVDFTTSNTQDFVNWSVGDANNDGKSDVLATQPQIYKSRVFVDYGDAGRQFANRTSVLIGRCIDGPASAADMDGNGSNDLIVEEHDCSNANTGPLYVDVLTRNANSSYNADQTVFWAQPINGTVYPLPNPPQVLRANTDSKPDLLVTQCADDRCDGYRITTQINTTEPYSVLCYPPNGTRGINVCTPSPGPQYSESSPVTFNIGASGTVPQRDVEVWIDGKKVAEQIDGFSNYTLLYTTLPVSLGHHQVDIYAAGWDQSLQKKSFDLWVQ
jgi:hypothetical protein